MNENEQCMNCGAEVPQGTIFCDKVCEEHFMGCEEMLSEPQCNGVYQ